MDEEKAKNNVIQLMGHHLKREANHTKPLGRQPSHTTQIHFENVHLKDCTITVINKTIIKPE